MTAGVRLLPFSRTLRYSLLAMIWISVTLGFALRNDPDLMLFGGVFGYEASNWLVGLVGQPGTVLLLIFVLLSFLIVINLLPFLKKKKEDTILAEADLQGDMASNIPKEDLYNPMNLRSRMRNLILMMILKS